MPDMLKAWVANKSFLVRPDGTILFVRDSGTSEGHENVAGKWDIPGGRMDVGEIDMRAALRRELEEEVGLKISDDTHTELLLSDMVHREDGEYVCMHYYQTAVHQGFEPMLSSEHNDYGWYTAEEALEKLNLFDSFRRAVNAYVANRDI